MPRSRFELSPPPDETTVAEYLRQHMVGQSPAFLQCVRLVRRMASCDATVLIQGETGTGKEVAARAIHALSRRRNAPFVPVNCGGLPETLVESELFGHVRGAFTDARESRTGLVAQAESGTLFLDEVEAMGPRAQVALLRFLQDHRYRAVGGNVVHDANVRVVASSNADLQAMVARGAFRQDLLFRLNLLPLDLPPLRDRGSDGALLADTFVRRFNHEYPDSLKTIDPASIDWIRRQRWPGNVRELENVIHRQFLLSESPVIHLAPGDPSAPAAGEASFQAAREHAIAEFERRYLIELLTRTNGNISLAARLSGKERSRLGKLAKKHGVDRERFAGDEAPSAESEVGRIGPTPGSLYRIT